MATRRQTTSHSERDTRRLGEQLAHELKGGEVLALIGNLGSGKTTFLKGLAKGLGIKQHITSPTFVLMKIYKVRRKKIRRLVHVDCYRVAGRELSQIGLDDYLQDPQTIVAIEWAAKFKTKLAHPITISFKHGKNTDERTINW